MNPSLDALSNIDFMREIGWLKKDSAVPNIVSGSRADANAVNAMKLQMSPDDDDDFANVRFFFYSYLALILLSDF